VPSAQTASTVPGLTMTDERIALSAPRVVPKAMTPAQAADRVTIVVATRNRRRELLASVPRHIALPECPRVIVVDDASTDATVEMLATEFPQVDVIRLPQRAGAAAR